MDMNTSDKFLKHTGILAAGTIALLLIPFTGMQFSNEVDWSARDFILAGTLLFGTGFSFLLITRNSDNILYKAASGMAALSGLFLVWSNLAVGLIGSEDETINLVYFGVIAIGLIGAFLARFKAQGMALTLFGMAIACVVITVVALSMGMQDLPHSSVTEIIGVNSLFILLFTLSGILYHHVAQDEKKETDLDITP